MEFIAQDETDFSDVTFADNETEKLSMEAHTAQFLTVNDLTEKGWQAMKQRQKRTARGLVNHYADTNDCDEWRVSMLAEISGAETKENEEHKPRDRGALMREIRKDIELTFQPMAVEHLPSLIEDVLSGRQEARHILLTGDAGLGKTACVDRIKKWLEGFEFIAAPTCLTKTGLLKILAAIK